MAALASSFLARSKSEHAAASTPTAAAPTRAEARARQKTLVELVDLPAGYSHDDAVVAKAKQQRALQAAHHERLPEWRKRAAELYRANAFQGFFTALILLYAVVLGFADPMAGEAEGRNGAISAVEPAFTLLFSVDLAVALAGVPGYLKSVANLLDAFLVLSGYLALLGLELNVGILRTIRVLRPLRTLNKFPAMKLLVNSLIASVPGLMNVLALVSFVCLVFMLFGLKLWAGVLSHRCVRPLLAADRASEWWVGWAAQPERTPAPWDAQVMTTGAGAHYEVSSSCSPTIAGHGQCDRSITWAGLDDGGEAIAANSSEGWRCVETGSPCYGRQGFDNAPQGLLTVFQVMTTEGWTSLIDSMLAVQSVWLVMPFFSLLIWLGAFFVTNYLLAEVCVVFSTQLEIARQQESELALIAAHATPNGQPRSKSASKLLMSPTVLSPSHQKVSPMGRGYNTSHHSPSFHQPSWRSTGKPLTSWGEENATQTELDAEEALNYLGGSGHWRAADGEASSAPPELSSPVPPEHSASSVGNETSPTSMPGSEIADSDSSVSGNWPMHALRDLCHRVVTRPSFGVVVDVLIFANFLLLASERHGQSEEARQRSNQLNLVLTGLFASEMLLKVAGFGVAHYLEDGFCRLDAVIVLSSVAEATVSNGSSALSVFRMLRLVRIIRALKLVTNLSTLRKLLETAMGSLQGVGNFAGLLWLVLYIYALLGMSLFGGKQFLGLDGKVPRSNFNDIQSALVTVFQIATRENWNELLYQAIRIEGWAIPTAYYVSLLLLSSYIILSLFIGTVLEHFQRFFVLGSQTSRRSLAFGPGGFASESLGPFESSTTLLKTALSVPVKILGRARRMTSGAMGIAKQRPVDTGPLAEVEVLGFGQARARKLVEHRRFDQAVIFSIVTSSAAMAFETPGRADGPPTDSAVTDVLRALDAIFTAIFVLEMASKLVALRGKYWQLSWNLFDGAITVLSVAALVPSLSKLRPLRVLRAFRTLRILQTMQKYPGMKAVGMAMIDAVAPALVVAAIAVFFILMCAILFCQLYRGTLYYCTDEATHARIACHGSFVHERGALATRQWATSRQNFDDVLSASLALSEVMTLEDWPQTMHFMMDATDVDHGPLRGSSPFTPLLFVAFIIIGAFFIMNLFVGVIVSKYNEAQLQGFALEAKAEAQHARGVTRIDDMVHEYLRKQKRLQHEHDASLNAVTRATMLLVAHPNFEFASLALILLNVFSMCFERVGATELEIAVLSAANIFFVAFFTAEIIVKVIALGLGRWWESSWNRFDFVIVTASLVELSFTMPVDPSFLRVFRIFRLARILRVADKAKGIKNLVQTFIETLPYLISVLSLVSVFMFIFAVLGVSLFGRVKRSENLTASQNFDNIFAATFSLFRMMTGEDWTGLMRDCMVQPPLCSEELGDCGSSALAPAYFLVYMVTIPYASMNVIIAVILFTFFDLSKESLDASFDKAHIISFDKEWKKFDPRDSGVIHIRYLDAVIRGTSRPLGKSSAVAAKEVAEMIALANGMDLNKWPSMRDIETTEQAPTAGAVSHGRDGLLPAALTPGKSRTQLLAPDATTAISLSIVLRSLVKQAYRVDVDDPDKARVNSMWARTRMSTIKSAISPKKRGIPQGSMAARALAQQEEQEEEREQQGQDLKSADDEGAPLVPTLQPPGSIN